MLRHETNTETGTNRYDTATLSSVTRLAQELQHRHTDTLTAREIEQIGEEVGLSPVFIRDALRQVAAEKTVQETQPLAQPAQVQPVQSTLSDKLLLWGGFSKAWWSAAWTLPFFAIGVTEGEPGPFFAGWGVYIGVGSFLGHLAAAAREQMAPGTVVAAPNRIAPAVVPVNPGSVSRQELINALFSIQQTLDSQKEYRVFLSIDVVGSSEMKRNSDELSVEYSFSQYHQWVHSICKLYGGEVHSSAGDGSMCAFPSAEQALRAARRLQDGMEGFNRERNRLPGPFRVRCGISAGHVALDPSRPLGALNSAVVDRAAVMQRRGEPGDIVVSSELVQPALLELGALAPLSQEGGDAAFSWLAARRSLR